MRTAKWIQLIWMGLAVLSLTPLLFRPGLERNPEYVVAYVCCFIRPWRWVWWLALGLPLGPIAIMAKAVIVNAWLIVSWQSPYRDQPSALVGAFLIFGITLAPAVLIYYFLFRDRHRLARILFQPDTSADSLETGSAS